MHLRVLEPGWLAVLRQAMESLVFVLHGGARSRLEHHRGPLCVLIGVPNGSDLIQGQHVDLLAEGISGVRLRALPASVTGHLQQGLRPTATLSSGLHQLLKVWSLQQA